MLKIETYIEESKIPNAGIGLYTKEFIEKGRIIWYFDPDKDILLYQPDVDFLKSVDLFEYTEKYGTCNEALKLWELDGDNTRFMNHSFSPNIHFNEVYGIALEDIDINEELTCDYTTITTPDHFNKLIKTK